MRRRRRPLAVLPPGPRPPHLITSAPPHTAAAQPPGRQRPRGTAPRVCVKGDSAHPPPPAPFPREKRWRTGCRRSAAHPADFHPRERRGVKPTPLTPRATLRGARERRGGPAHCQPPPRRGAARGRADTATYRRTAVPRRARGQPRRAAPARSPVAPGPRALTHRPHRPAIRALPPAQPTGARRRPAPADGSARCACEGRYTHTPRR